MKQLAEYYRGKEVLVTGGAGFIGSHLVDLLVSNGAVVTVLDNLSSGRLSNLAQVQDHIHFVHGDITDAATCYDVTADKSVIFHLAAFISVPRSVIDPQHCMQVNVEGTHNLLEAAVAHNVSNFVFSSSSSVYGMQAGTCSEKTPLAPQSPYAHSKRDGELLCEQYAQSSGISAACLRYFNVYGNRQNPQGDYAAVVAKFHYNLAHNLPLTVFGDGKQTRDFIHVSQVALANALMGMHRGLTGEPVNVATGKSITLLELIAQLEIETGLMNNGITFAPARAGDIIHSAADCDKLLRLIEKI